MGAARREGALGMIVRGPDGLPHCTACRGEALCEAHRRQVHATLNRLWTAQILMRAESDIRHIIHRQLTQEAYLGDELVTLAEARAPQPRRKTPRRRR